ncbi:MAG: PAS domain S-box protein [Planctomycetaceae bacterium]|nr:PAS domain S-box protein [Planctomycetaceae bacterium]
MQTQLPQFAPAMFLMSAILAVWVIAAILVVLACLAAVVFLRRRKSAAAAGQPCDEYRRRMDSLISNLFGVAYRCGNQPEWPMGFISRGCLELTGYAPIEFVSGRVMLNDLIHPDDRDAVWQHVQRAVAGKGPFNIEYRLTDRHGRLHWVVERGCGLWNGDRLEAIEGLIVDVTDFKNAQQQLQQSREFLESVIRSAPTGISVTVDRVYVSVNDQFCRMFGYAREELIGHSARMLYADDAGFEEFGRSIYEPMRRDGSVTIENTFVKKDGTRIEVQMSGAPIDPSDWSKGITFSLLDVSEQKRMTEKLSLRLKLERLVADISAGFVNLGAEGIDDQIVQSLRTLIDRTGIERVRIALIAPDTNVLSLSPYFCNDANASGLFETGDMDRDLPEYAAVVRENRIIYWPSPESIPSAFPSLRRFFADKSIRSHLIIPMTAGQEHVGALMFTNMRDTLQIDPDLLGYFRAVADTFANAIVRRNYLKALSDSERRFRNIIECSPMGVLTYWLSPDETLILTGTNPAASKILNADISGFIGKRIEEAFPQLGKELTDTYRRIGRQGGSYHGDNYSYRDGRINGIYEFEAFQTSPGKIAVMFSDITDRRTAEQARERLMRQLSLKNQDLEGLVYIASHDLRSPLVNIRGFSGELETGIRCLNELLRSEPLSANARSTADRLFNSDFPEALAFINSGSAKMETMLDGLLSLSRVGAAQGRPERIDVNDLLSHIARQFRFLLGRNAGDLDIAPGLPACIGDRLLLGQVFSNCIDNAIKYRASDRRLLIRVTGETRDDCVQYRVIDNGIGIAAEHIHKVFDIFHQLEPARQGQGLGLTIVRKIIEKHDGRVWLQSVVGQGTTVYIELPKP